MGFGTIIGNFGSNGGTTSVQQGYDAMSDAQNQYMQAAVGRFEQDLANKEMGDQFNQFMDVEAMKMQMMEQVKQFHQKKYQLGVDFTKKMMDGIK